MPPHMSQTPTDLIEGRERIKKKRQNYSNTKRGKLFSSWRTCETSRRLWNGSRPRPTRSRNRSSSVARPRTCASKTERGKKEETQKNSFFCYTHAIFMVELRRGLVVFQRWWSRTGRWGRWKRGDHWSMHTYSISIMPQRHPRASQQQHVEAITGIHQDAVVW